MKQILKSNLEEINRMSQIVEDLLLLSRADSGEIRLNKEDIEFDRDLKRGGCSGEHFGQI